jgi:hypothetical protein
VTLAAGDKATVASSFRELAEIASAIAGSRVAPNIEWTEDGKFANDRGSRTTPSYTSASSELTTPVPRSPAMTATWNASPPSRAAT